MRRLIDRSLIDLTVRLWVPRAAEIVMMRPAMTSDDRQRPAVDDRLRRGVGAREWLVRGVLLLLAVIACEGLLRFAVVRHGHVERLLDKPWYYLVPLGVPETMPEIDAARGAYRVYDPALGWTLGRLGRSEPLYYSNARGFRCSRADHERAAAGLAAGDDAARYDVVAIGDSFTHGDEVTFEQAWPARLEAKTGLRVLNLGVGGYGVDQAIWRYERTPVDAPLVLLGLIAGDLERARTQVYNLTLGGLKTKPMFDFTGGSRRVVNRPAIHGEALRREYALGTRSAFFRREPLYGPALFARSWLDRSYLVRVPRSLGVAARFRHPPILTTPGLEHDRALAILEFGRDLAQRRGARLVVVLLGNNNTFQLRTEIADPWALLRRGLAARGIDVVSTADQLYAEARDDPAAVINPGGVHYTPSANDRVAELVAASEPLAALSDAL